MIPCSINSWDITELSKHVQFIFREETSLGDLNDQKMTKICKEATIACSFLERLKARTDNFRKIKNLIN